MINFNCMNASFIVAYQSLEDVHVMIVKLGFNVRCQELLIMLTSNWTRLPSMFIGNGIDVDELTRPS